VTVVLVAQAVATLALVGLVWFVQVVHYPLFARVPRDAFPAYEREHARRTTRVVAPLMGVEGVCAGVLVAAEPGALTVLGALLVAGIWASTIFVQVPCHRVLEQGWDEAAHRRLVRTNWLRTAMWSARGAVAVALLA
jgi:sterol desaturase/sphingolipid hydroxylase (fatty acid hydroxylase superfamily)